MINSIAEHRVNYGVIELAPDGNIQHVTKEVEELLLDRRNEHSKNLFQCITNKELKSNLHDCFMGRSNQFILTIDAQQYFFLFHKTFHEQKLEKIYIYMFHVNQLQNLSEPNNWNHSLLSSIGEMAAGIAHEVRNPLTAVKGFLQLLDKTYNTEYINIAQSELERAIITLNDLMSVSKPEFGVEQAVPLNLCTELESTILLFQNQLYHIKVVKNFENKNANIIGKKDQIKKAFFNLIKNAIEAMPDGGTLVVNEYEDIQNIHITISDTGVGIPKDKLRLLGTPFFTLKQDGKGMGLAQVFNAVQNNHAKIHVNSKEGQGTTFHLSFLKNQKKHVQYKGGNTMSSVIDMESSLSEFLNQNLKVYTKEWLQYIKKNKGYIAKFLDGSGDLETYETEGNPLFKIVADHIFHLKTDEVMEIAKEMGIHRAKTDFPIHMAWEIFQSSRGVIWSAIKAFYSETNSTLDMEEFFELERRVNDIIDMFIDSYTAYYVNYKDEMLNSHRQTLDELSVPIIPLTEKVCILPIVGNVDTYRAKKIREKTLVKVKELKAQQLIIDISAVPYVDTAVVNHLFKIVKGIKLLGCSTILTGISAEIADTMIELGIEIGDELKTRSDLQQALQEIMS
ncbi:ATP-binding protein [Metabacillus sediminilitoris]|uniref:histidine kinase n=1 Tax=Metabacillus sediminilitoris TaxID=2567941 RepID=A0A4S4C3X5_9BACI|nr:ATP-binding protein [Metabacillus sediminilitoris]QGQ45228.1 STAS domain-containing protein [Metabacillus sediminilitoris]THF82473.1 STAS domain-containing protein [Metabacillus sediminilitoris]